MAVRLDLAAQAPPVTVDPRAVVWVAFALSGWVLVRWIRHRLSRARLTRTVSRSLGSGRRRPSARGTRRVLARSTSARRAARSFRSALLIGALIALVWLVVQVHGPTG